MKKLFFALLIGTMAIFSSCEKCGDEQEFCTEEFRRINIFIDNSTQIPVSFDEVYTLRGTGTQKLLFDQTGNEEGSYVVIDDSYHPSLKNTEDDFRFIGVKNNQVVVDKTFRIKADNCHVFKVSGPDSVMVP